MKLNVGTIVVAAVLIAIMIGALWFAASAWTKVLSGLPMPPVCHRTFFMLLQMALAIGAVVARLSAESP